MHKKRLGNTGLLVTQMCFGTWTFGNNRWGAGGLAETEARKLIDQSLNAGVNFFDTSNNYSEGEAEKLLGLALKGKRDQVVISSKVRSPVGEGANDQGLSRQHIMRQIDATLSRLQTDYLDLYIIHGWDSLTPVEETQRALSDLVSSGKVRYLGCSNIAAWQVVTFLKAAELGQMPRFEMYQGYYNLVGRDLEDELIPMCDYHKLGIMTWGPLANGLLSGKYRHGGKGRRDLSMFAQFPPVDAPSAERVLDAVAAVAAELGSTMAAVSLAWQLANPAITSVILGATGSEQLAQNLAATALVLTSEHLDRLNGAAPRAPSYPGWMIGFHEQARQAALKS